MKPALALLVAVALAGSLLPAQDCGKMPYLPSKVYGLRLIPGAPAIVELPMGEIAHNIWYDKSFFKAESTPDTNRVVVQATNTPEAVGKISYIHIETEPSNLRVTWTVRTRAPWSTPRSSSGCARRQSTPGSSPRRRPAPTSRPGASS
jgi:hypothetical protein